MKKTVQRAGKGEEAMKNSLDNNQMKVSEIVIPAQGLIPEIAVVRNIRLAYVLDSEGRKTDKIDAIRYDCVNTENFSTFTVKVETTKPVITKELMEASETPIYIRIPVGEVVIKPYAINYGVASVSIIAPFVKLIEN